MNRLWRWLTHSKPPTEPVHDPKWLDDDDPIARIVNAAWESDEMVIWNDGDPLPPRAEKPLRVEDIDG